MKGELINFWAYANPTSSRRNHGNEGVGTVGQIQFQLAGRSEVGRVAPREKDRCGILLFDGKGLAHLVRIYVLFADRE